MEILPALQGKLFLGAFLLGVLQGGIFSLLTALHVPLGAYQPPKRYRALYQRRLPCLPAGVPFPCAQKRRHWRCTVIFVTDLLFCLEFSASLILLLYAYHNGALRLAVPILALLGFAAFRVALSHVLVQLTAFESYVLLLLFAYLRLFLRFLCRTLCGILQYAFRPVRALFAALWRCYFKRRSLALCRAQLQAARRGLAPVPRREVHHVKRQKEKASPAMGDLSAYHRHFFGGAFHFRQSIDGAGSAAKGKGRAAKAKRGA